jgi:hypothetical protein
MSRASLRCLMAALLQTRQETTARPPCITQRSAVETPASSSYSPQVPTPHDNAHATAQRRCTSLLRSARSSAHPIPGPNSPYP